MIPRPYIAKWQEQAPWKDLSQVEQDLIISRVLVEIFSDDFLRDNLAFRGGTALHKLFLHPAPRYSEDIDLVQIIPGPIKPVMERLGEVITFFEADRKTDNRGHGIKALYRFTSEYEGIRMRLKLEINCFRRYIEFATRKKAPSQKEFLHNIEAKEMDPDFTGEITDLLRPGIAYDLQEAFQWLKDVVIRRM